MKPSPRDITVMLEAARAGDARASERLFPVICGELRSLAAALMRGQSPGHTLQATALVHEAYLRLVDLEAPWESRAHFFAGASRAMRSILVDHARRRRAAKRGGRRKRTPLDEVVVELEERSGDLIALDEALGRLAGMDETKARIVEQRFFAGLTIEETARALGVSHATVEREWAVARAWLFRAIRRDGGDGGDGGGGGGGGRAGAARRGRVPARLA